MGTFAVLPVTALSALCTLFIYYYLPESKDRELDELLNIWKDQPKQRNRCDEKEAFDIAIS